MPLPTIETEAEHFVKITLPSGRTIGVKPWRVKEEKELLFAIDSDEIENKIKHIVKMLSNCVDNKNTFAELSEADIKMLTIEARKLSIGDSIDFTYKCQGVSGVPCGYVINDSMTLTNNSTVKVFDVTPLAVNDKLSLTFCDLPYATALQIYEKHKDSNAQYQYYRMINSIDSVTYNGITHTTFSEAEMEKFLDPLAPKDMNVIADSFKARTSDVKLSKDVTCIKCKTKADVTVDDMLSFLVL